MSTISQFKLLNSFRESLTTRGLLPTILLAFDFFPIFSNILKQFVSGETFIKYRFYVLNGYFPDIENPTSFNEKIQHRKLYENDTRYPIISDKYAVRKLVSDKIGNHILTDLYHVTDDPETIPFDSLPDQYVVKPNHMSGEILFVDSGDDVDVDEIKVRCEDWLDTTYGQTKGEYWYAEIAPKILIEEDLRGEIGRPPQDYKLFVFNGAVKYIQVDSDRFGKHKRRFYDTDWNPQAFRMVYPLANVIEPPKNLENMIRIAEVLGANYDFLRVDLYEIEDSQIRFGELTVAPESGTGHFIPRDVDFKLGQHWNQKQTNDC